MITKQLFKKIISGKVTREQLDSLELLDEQKDIIFDKIKNGGGDGGNDFLSDWIKKHNWIKIDFTFIDDGGRCECEDYMVAGIKSDDLGESCDLYYSEDISLFCRQGGITYLACTKEIFLLIVTAYDMDEEPINISDKVFNASHNEVINFLKNKFN